MPVLVTCKFDEDSMKNEGVIVSTTFSPLLYGKKVSFVAQGQVLPK